MPLDSDVSNADSQLHVEFYNRDVETPNGKLTTPFVRIMVPGDKTNIIDQPARDHHKARFPRQWLHFQMQGTDASVIGVPLSEWMKERPQDVTDMQVAELQILKFQTVEQVATASDTQLQRIGMGAAGLRNLARTYLQNRNALAAGSELAETKRQLAQMQEQMAALMASQAKRGPGRPPKEADAA